ncbi:MAG: HEPN domain-containing protein [Ruminococcus sp.]|nr:HEPN domain-containing protein [Ruminococcus sp.]
MSRANNSTDSRRYYDWFYRSELDLLSARALIEDKRLYDPAVFHCVQAIEKSFKAFLLFNTRRLFDGHNLVWLCKQCVLLHEFFRSCISKTAPLNRYYIETRYPADVPELITKEFAENTLKTVIEITDFIREYLKFDFNSYKLK